MKSHSVLRNICIGIALAGILPGCSRCSGSRPVPSFHGISSAGSEAFQVPASGGKISVPTRDLGVVEFEIAPGTFTAPQAAELRATQDQEMDEEFQSNPASVDYQRLPGEFRLILGKQPPAKDLWLCFDQKRIFQEGKEAGVVPLVHWIYDGGNETLPYFSEPASRIDPSTRQMCVQLEPKMFGSLDHAEGRLELAVLFGKRVSPK